jgi:ribonuclease P protein subunit RPR2
MKLMPSRNSFQSRSKKKRIRKSRQPLISQEDIKEQVIFLLEEADKIIGQDFEMAQKYALQARKIQMRTRIKFPSEWSKRFCKHCKSFLYPGINSRIRLSSSNKIISIKCFHCNGYSRIPYNQNVEEKNENEN